MRILEAQSLLVDFSTPQLSKHFENLLKTARGSAPADQEKDYISLFSHSIQGRCPLYESEYGESDERLQQPHELSDLSAFYRAFGLKLRGSVHERADFIAVECEFMAFMCVKQAYAEEHDDTKLTRLTMDAQRKFMRDHLGRWVPAFARRVIDQSDDNSFYGSLAHFTLVYVTDDCRSLGVTPGKEHLRLRLPMTEEDACVTCPMAEQMEANE